MSNIIYSFSCVSRSWANLPIVRSSEFALLPAVKPAVKEELKVPPKFYACCKLHLANHPRCIYNVTAQDVPDVKPILVVHYHFGAGASRVAEEDIACLQAKGALRSGCDAIKYVNGEWYGLGTADACYYKDFVPGAVPAEEFLNLISIKPSILMDYAGGVFNFYKLVIISSAYDPRYMYIDCYGKVAGLEAAMSRMELCYSVAKISGSDLCYSATQVKWSDIACEPDEYRKAMKGMTYPFHRPAKWVASVLSKKRERSPAKEGKPVKAAGKSDKISGK